MRRPSLSESSFLAHVFAPKKNALPTGLRKRHIEFVKGRRKARVNAFNKMLPWKQELLQRTGKREDYLRGTVTFTDAKRQLRERAVSLGLVKPLRQRRTPVPQAGYSPSDRRARLEAMIGLHIGNTALANQKRVNWRTIEKEVVFLDPPKEEMREWSYGRIKYAGRKGSEFERVTSDGVIHNPFWYH